MVVESQAIRWCTGHHLFLFIVAFDVTDVVLVDEGDPERVFLNDDPTVNETPENDTKLDTLKADSHELHLSCTAAADGCIAAADIGYFLFFCSHPSATAAYIKHSSCESAKARVL